MTALALAAVAAALHASAAGPATASAAPPSPAARAPTRTVRAGTMRFGVRTVGRGRPVVLIQGLSGTIDGWDPTFVDALAAAGHRVVLFDNAGIGRTTRRPGALTVRTMADDAARLIERLHLDRPDVVGWSMGGMIAQDLAIRRPRLVRRLVLLATAPGDGKATLPSGAALALLGGAGDAATATDLLFPSGQAAARERFVRHLRLRRGPIIRAPASIVRQQVAASAAWLLGQLPEGRRLRELRAPTFVGGGELDQLLPVANQRHLAATIPGARLVVFSDAAHAFYLQHLREVLPRLRRFLRPGG